MSLDVCPLFPIRRSIGLRRGNEASFLFVGLWVPSNYVEFELRSRLSFCGMLLGAYPLLSAIGCQLSLSRRPNQRSHKFPSLAPRRARLDFSGCGRTRLSFFEFRDTLKRAPLVFTGNCVQFSALSPCLKQIRLYPFAPRLSLYMCSTVPWRCSMCSLRHKG